MKKSTTLLGIIGATVTIVASGQNNVVQLGYESVPQELLPVTIATTVSTNLVLPSQFGVFENVSYESQIATSEIVVAIEVTNVVPMAITNMEKTDLSAGLLPELFWTRVDCSVVSVKRGKFPFTSIQFVSCEGAHRRMDLPYVKGFAYDFGLVKTNGGWLVVGQNRVSPLPPFLAEDHMSFWALREYKGARLSVWDSLVDRVKKTWPSPVIDVSVEKTKFFVITFEGDQYREDFRGCGKGVEISVYDWETGYPLFGGMPKEMSLAEYIKLAETNDINMGEWEGRVQKFPDHSCMVGTNIWGIGKRQ